MSNKRMFELNKILNENNSPLIKESWSNSKAQDIALDVATMNKSELTDFFETVMSIATGNQSKLILSVVQKAEKDGRFLHKKNKKDGTEDMSDNMKQLSRQGR